MANKIIGIRSLTVQNGLKAAFGYESYPNGNHGYSLAAINWLSKHSLGKWVSRGNPHVEGRFELTVEYFTHSVLAELQALAGEVSWKEWVTIPALKKRRLAAEEATRELHLHQLAVQQDKARKLRWAVYR